MSRAVFLWPLPALAACLLLPWLPVLLQFADKAQNKP